MAALGSDVGFPILYPGDDQFCTPSVCSNSSCVEGLTALVKFRLAILGTSNTVAPPLTQAHLSKIGLNFQSIM